MSNVLILSKTKMQDNRVCVGGVDLTNQCSVRLLDNNGRHEKINQCPYEILTVWDIEYVRTNRRPAPHLEDINVQSRRKTAFNIEPQELLKLPHYNIKVYNNTSLLSTFNCKLCSTEKGSLYICEKNGVTNFSTCFWICDKPLYKSKFSTPEKIKYRYHADDNKWYNITFVGLDDIPDVIIQGSLIRLSLAHWWSPDNTIENRCYLQISGIYTIPTKTKQTGTPNAITLCTL